MPQYRYAIIVSPCRTDMCIMSVLSLGHWVAAAVWHTQKYFKWLALRSFVFLGIGVAAYQGWSRRWGLARESRATAEGDGT